MTARASSSKQTATVVTPRASVACSRSAASRPGRSRSMSTASMRACWARPGCASRIACRRASASRSMTVMVVVAVARLARRGLDQAAAELADADDHQVRRSRAGRGRERVVGEQQPGAGRVDVEEVEAHAARRGAQRLVAHQRAEAGVAEVHGGAQRAGAGRALRRSRWSPRPRRWSRRCRRRRPPRPPSASPACSSWWRMPRVALDDPAVAPAQRCRRRRSDGSTSTATTSRPASASAVGDARAAVAQPEHDRVAAAATGAPRVGAPARDGGDALEQRCRGNQRGRASAPPGAASWRCRARG